MLGNWSHLGDRAASDAPQMVTPVNFPSCELPTIHDASPESATAAIADVLRGLHRPNDVTLDHFRALGLHVVVDATADQLVPHQNYLPSHAWQTITREECQAMEPETPRTLSNQRPAPTAAAFVDRRFELSTSNEEAFRTVRRLPLSPGEKRARLGNAYEFFRNLELLSLYWRDTSVETSDGQPAAEPDAMDVDKNPEPPTVSSSSSTKSRGNASSSIPAEFRTGLINAFVKLVTYDFGCSVSMARVEPRLQLGITPDASTCVKSLLHTYFQSSCSFIYRTPTSRNEARAGMVEGPIAALSVRPQTSFPAQQDSLLDFSKELLALLITAQYRTREGKDERRFGDGQWWTSAPRWGGGSGGPIGKEIDLVEKQEKENGGDATPVAESSGLPLSHAGVQANSPPSGPSPAKKQKKTRLSMYDSYRMVRPPSSTWDRKAKYMAVGKIPQADFDDVFLVSSLFHHIAFLRLRVAVRDLEEIEGNVDAASAGERSKTPRQLTLWRSRWYDLFQGDDRVEAMSLLWGIMSWSMRSEDVPVAEVTGARSNGLSRAKATPIPATHPSAE